MPKLSKRLIPYVLLASFAVGELYAIIFSDETRWPFSSVPMFAQIKPRPTWTEYRPVAVTPKGEVNLVEAGALDYKVQRVLMAGYQKSINQGKVQRRAQLERDISDIVASTTRAAGIEDVAGVRIYASTWDLESLRAAQPSRSDDLAYEELFQ